MNESRLESLAASTDRQSGAARMTVFLALWSLALVVLHDVRVDAATIREVAAPQSNWLAAPAPLPKVDSAGLWDGLAERSEVLSGRWSPATAARHSNRAHGVTSAVRRVGTYDRAATTKTLASVASSDAPPAISKANSAAAPRIADKQARSVGRHLSAAPEPASTEPTANKAPSIVTRTEWLVTQQIASGDLTAAAASIETARTTVPAANARLRLLDARLAIARGDYERAYAQLLESLPDVRTTTEQHDLLAATMLRTKRFAESAAVYRALLSVDPRNARWWAGYAVAQSELGHRAESVGAYRTLQSVAPPGSPLALWASRQIDRMT